MSSGIENSVKKRNSRCRTKTVFEIRIILKSDKYRAHNGNIRGVHAKRQYPLPAAYLLRYERRNENYRRNTQAHRQIEVNILRDKRHGFTADKRTERKNNA